MAVDVRADGRMTDRQHHSYSVATQRHMAQAAWHTEHVPWECAAVWGSHLDNMSCLGLEIDVWIQKLLWHQIKYEKLPRGWVRYICHQFSLISKMKGLGQQWKTTVVKHFNVINYFNIKINILVKCTWLLMTDRETKTTLPSHCSLNRPRLALGKRC